MPMKLTGTVKKVMPYFIAVALASSLTGLTGCDLKEEKPYEYYVSHPEVLNHDYAYCETHPSAGVCINIVKKYFKYKKYHQQLHYSQNIPPTTEPKITTGTIFRDMDKPVSLFGTNG